MWPYHPARGRIIQRDRRVIRRINGSTDQRIRIRINGSLNTEYGHKPIRPHTNTATDQVRPQTNTVTSPGTRGGGVNRLYGGVTSERLRIWRHFGE